MSGLLAPALRVDTSALRVDTSAFYAGVKAFLHSLTEKDRACAFTPG